MKKIMVRKTAAVKLTSVAMAFYGIPTDCVPALAK